MNRLRFALHMLAVLALVASGIYYAALDEYRIGTVCELLALVVMFWGGDR